MPDTARAVLRRQELAGGQPGIPPASGQHLAHAAAKCLDDLGHSQGAITVVAGDFIAQYELYWQEPTDDVRRFYADQDEAVEFGAYAIAIMLIEHLAGLRVVQRSRRGTRFDYWLGDAGAPLHQRKARLEVSGIHHGREQDVRRRLRAKLEQLARSDVPLLGYVVVVVEFGSPQSRVLERWTT